MSKIFLYPTAEKIIEYNLLALTIINVKKADKPELLSHTKLEKVLTACKEAKGDLYDKASVLLKGLIKSHVFASGNRRTALIVTKYFVASNKGKFMIKDDPTQSKVMTGIREDFYSYEEIKNWIKNGKIREFKR